MNMQDTPTGGASMNLGNPPVLGSQVPGTTGGLPAQSGLSALKNPMAQELQSMGRGDDSVLVHMTPGEVNSLQGLAMATGGSLTINPQTGLPEAGWLGKLLPTLLGGLGMAFGIPPVWMGALGAVGGTVATGDLSKGLMMGLGAYGGASLAGGLGLGAKLGHVGADIGLGGSIARAAPTVAGGASTATQGLSAVDKIANVSDLGSQAGSIMQQAPGIMNTAAGMSGLGGAAVQQGATGLMGKFGEAAKAGLPGILQKAAVPAAVMGLAGALSPGARKDPMTGAIDNSYQGPYYAQKRNASFAPSTQDILSSSKERDYFDVDMPEIYNMQSQLVQPGSSTAPGTPIWQSVLNPKAKKGEEMYSFRPSNWMEEAPPVEAVNKVPSWARSLQPRYADGGEVDMGDGSFVVDARTVSELGNGSSNAGMDILSQMGGRPLDGPGDGVSDSIPARIGGKQEARVARDEVLMSPEAVRRIGGGDEKRGTQKLYALMDKAHKARKQAKRGQDTKLAKGLGALA